jgi:GNAT superfamily N-acetyltransferase
VTVRQITDLDDAELVGSFIAYSFDGLAANHYLVPDPARREAVMRDYFTLLAEHVLAGAGEVYGIGGLEAVAVWFDRTRDVDPPRDYPKRLAALAGEHFGRFAELEQVFDAHHPGEPHWHGAFFAVRPDLVGQGLGTRVIREKLSQLDAAGIPAYLEGTGPENCRLYRALGWRDMNPFAITLNRYATGACPGVNFYRMWREPESMRRLREKMNEGPFFAEDELIRVDDPPASGQNRLDNLT